MTIWHLRSKRKPTGGKLSTNRKKKRMDRGVIFLEIKIGERKTKIERISGGNKKIRLLSTKEINAADQKTGKVVKTTVLSVTENPANPHYVRRNIITKGAVVKTEIGLVKVTSRPSQNGVLNGILIKPTAQK